MFVIRKKLYAHPVDSTDWGSYINRMAKISVLKMLLVKQQQTHGAQTWLQSH
jgi:hypothetical protein